jgi:hypothetical protein
VAGGTGGIGQHRRLVRGDPIGRGAVQGPFAAAIGQLQPGLKLGLKSAGESKVRPGRKERSR